MVGAGTDTSRPKIEGGPVILLVRPQLAVNIGMCARAMANFGLTELRLIAPKSGWPPEGEWRESAYSAASGGIEVLENVTVYPSLRTACEDLHFIWATTARERGQLKPVLSPRAAMRQSSQGILQGQRHGILFGPERTGLENEEIGLADALLTFPVNPAYASLNLAQAVLLTGYEWFLAAHGDILPFHAPQKSPPAPRALIFSLFDYVEKALEEADFFRPLDKKTRMVRNLRNMFHRMQLTIQDVRTLRGAFGRLVEGPRRLDSKREKEKTGGVASFLRDRGEFT